MLLAKHWLIAILGVTLAFSPVYQATHYKIDGLGGNCNVIDKKNRCYPV